MKRKRYSEEKIISILKEHEAGASAIAAGRLAEQRIFRRSLHVAYSLMWLQRKAWTCFLTVIVLVGRPHCRAKQATHGTS